MFLRIAVLVHDVLAPAASRALRPARRLRGEAGQTTAEYALVLIAAAAIAVLVITWASKTDLISKLLDWVVGKVMGRAE